MATVLMPCVNCRLPIPVDLADLALLPDRSLFQAAHASGECPISAPPEHAEYSVYVDVFRGDADAEELPAEKLIGFNASVTAASLTDALPDLTRQISTLWERVQESAAIAEMV